ncbi:MAG TPA: hypothetical protein DEA22_09355 [Blastocatellia bacterium]|nr:hypothetical protein [Blastocatellia bacterium]
MFINQTEKEKLFKGLGIFQNIFRQYIVSVLTKRFGNDWTNAFLESVSPQQNANLVKSLENDVSLEKLIDFQHFKSFAIKNKELTRGDLGAKTNDLPTWLGEIAAVRHRLAHFDEIESDDATKAWIHLRTIARLIGKSDVEEELLNLEKGKILETTPTRLEKSMSTKPYSFETLDVVNSAKEEFRQMIFSNNVYLCPAQGGAYNHKQCKYIGIYWNKRVGAVARIEAVVDVHSKDKADIYWTTGNENNEAYINRAKEKALLLRPGDLPIRVFLLKDLHQTDFIKDSPGGMFGSKLYLNVEDLRVSNSEDLAKKLFGRKWSEFGL